MGMGGVLWFVVVNWKGGELWGNINSSGIKAQRINIAVAGNQVALISVDTVNNSVVVVKVPGNLHMFGVIHGYGQYHIGSVYQVGELDKRGGAVLSGTLQEFLAIPIEGYYYTLREMTDIRNFFLSWDFLRGRTTNFPLLRRLELVRNMWQLRFDKVRVIDLSKTAKPLVLADGSNALFLEPVEVDQILKGLLTESNLQDENFRVEVINTTTTAGLAGRAARLLTNLGLTVIHINGNAQALSQCKIRATKEALKSQTVWRIAQIYRCQKEEKPEESRAAISLYLGTDYADWLGK